jgi:hypothetical protein
MAQSTILSGGPINGYLGTRSAPMWSTSVSVPGGAPMVGAQSEGTMIMRGRPGEVTMGTRACHGQGSAPRTVLAGW